MCMRTPERCGKTAVHSAGRIEMCFARFGGDDNPSAYGLRDVIAQRLRNGVERQRAVREPLHEGKAAHLLAPLRADSAVALA